MYFSVVGRGRDMEHDKKRETEGERGKEIERERERERECVCVCTSRNELLIHARVMILTKNTSSEFPDLRSTNVYRQQRYMCEISNECARQASTNASLPAA